MTTTPGELTNDQRDALLRWRLVLGQAAEQAPCDLAAAFGLADLARGDGGQCAAHLLPPDPEADVFNLDGTLDFLYGERPDGRGGFDLSGAIPHIPRWLADIRRYFPNDVVALIQRDAVERRGLRQLVLEKETLPKLERNVDLLATLVALQAMIPDETRETARQVVREIAEEVRKKLEPRIRTAVLGALNRNRHSALPVYRNIDWKRTIRRNLKNYDAESRRLVPERFYFWANQQRLREWHIIVSVDQSGSMASSVVYSSIMASIFASLGVLQTSLVFWSTEVVDMTEMLRDPVDLLFGAQLGGGTDAPKAIEYCSGLVQQPEKTILVFISDLYTSGEDEMVAGLRELVESKVKVICLLALTDAGKPSYDHQAAKRVAALGIPTLACTPNRLIDFVAAILQGREIDARAAKA
jgi:hypothetical protein